MCFRLIDAKKAQHPVSRLCEVLGVSRAGDDAWTERPPSERHRDGELSRLIGEVHAESQGT
jgi:putative transposase